MIVNAEALKAEEGAAPKAEEGAAPKAEEGNQVKARKAEEGGITSDDLQSLTLQIKALNGSVGDLVKVIKALKVV